EGRAASAGIRPGDVILSLAGTPVRGYADLAACLRGRGAGEQVAVVVSRAGKSLPLTMTLRPDRLQVFEGRRDDFPTVLEHDLPLAGNESGGPLVDRMGKAVGASIAVGPVGGMLIPADCVRRLLPALKSGSVAANWRPAAAAPPSGEQGPLAPVTLTLDGVAQRLRERGSRYQSLLVEYDVALEPHVEPRTLMSWGMPALRGYTERHRTGFAGAKRLADVVVAGPLLHGAPEEEVEPDPNAPPAVAAAVEQARRNAAVRKGRGDAGRLIAVRQPSESRQRFDGRESFQWIEEARRYGRVPPSELSSPVMYLASVGLRPLDPQPTPAQRAAQRRYSFAEGLDRYEKCRVLPQTEAVDGSPCVVLEGEYNQAGDGGRELRGERIWLDPKLGFAPRRWEQRVDGALVATVSHAAFEEAAPGCWLPWESTWTSAAPAWTAPSFRGSPAYSWVMRLRRVRVNDLPDELFRP
ncbi:MAG TPA: PDZ domain-containing protein, partial [Armatimonadota bacterium]|nr:PDZ domain-containing protein [Armatimonadota bacterium]